MWHVYRQIQALRNFDPLVITQKRRNAETFPFSAVEVIPRGNFRFLGRFLERRLGWFPWQLSAGETKRMLDVLETRNAGVLHVFFGNSALHLLPLLRECPMPIVVSFHGADVAQGRMTAHARKALQEVFYLAAVVGCRSEALKRDLVALGCPEEKLRIFRTIVPVPEESTPHFQQDGAWRFVQACRFIEKKGADLSLRAFAEFQKTHPQAELIMAGDGPEKERLQQLAGKLGITARWPGFLSQTELQKLFQSAHVFLHPSRTTGEGDREGIPNAMLEAMAAGLPVIATRHGGIPEAVTDDREGFLVSENDVPALVDGMNSLAADPARYAEMSRAARHRVLREFSAEAQAANLGGIYSGLLT